ncbi:MULTISPECIES: hypothetical protein [Thermomonosporaceae]|uniref:hypothetical protein n=1 Tax=Thermomonosporaceae TaxID=2012 RepID=UPI00255AA22B|nr:MULTISPECIES: hypothetical protein [Thermomonosporaceae]MDL4771078.1 hypothetical protein [Actinomadura xylanilytica]
MPKGAVPAVLLALVTASCSPSGSAKDDVSAAMDAFVKAARDGDVKEVCGHMAKVYRDGGCEQNWSDRAFLATLGKAGVKVGKVDEKAGEATVSVTVPGAGGRPRTSDWELVRVDGDWQIALMGR